MQEKEQIKSPIKQRILQYISELGISKREFYQQTGISRGTLEGVAGITEDTMAKFIARYPNVNPEWLLSGIGNSNKEEQKKDVDAIKIATINKSTIGIPLIPIDAMAGAFTAEQTVMDYDCERYIIPAFKGADFLITVKGYSMHPTYSNGDIVACKRVYLSDMFFQWNKVYVLDTNQGALIKRIKPCEEEGYITLISDNEDYDPIKLHKSSLNGIALVIGTIKTE